MTQVFISPAARADLKDIGKYISRETSGERSRAVLRKIKETIQLYATQPHIGSNREKLRPGLRSFVVYSYVVFYIPIPNGIDVRRVIQGSRDLSEIDF